MTFRASPWFALALLCCCNGREEDSRWANVQLSGEWRVIPAAYGPAMFDQCSRDVPAPAERFFTPSQAEIAETEDAVSRRLASTGYFAREKPIIRDNFRAQEMITEQEHRDFPVTLASGWAREYVGVERHGQRSIYGNYVMRSAPLPPGTPVSAAPQIICDGGPTFFGAEYDLEEHRITHLAFNGPG